MTEFHLAVQNYGAPEELQSFLLRPIIVCHNTDVNEIISYMLTKLRSVYIISIMTVMKELLPILNK